MIYGQKIEVGRVAVFYLDLQVGGHGDVLTCGHIMTPEFAS